MLLIGFRYQSKSAVKSYLTAWCNQNLSNRALNALIVLASTTESDRLFQMSTIRAEKNACVGLCRNETGMMNEFVAIACSSGRGLASRRYTGLLK